MLLAFSRCSWSRTSKTATTAARMSSSRMSSFSSSCIRNLQMFPTFFMTDSKQDPLLFGFLKKEFSDRIPFFAEASRQKILWLYAWKQCLFLPPAFKSTRNRQKYTQQYLKSWTKLELCLVQAIQPFWIKKVDWNLSCIITIPVSSMTR